MVDATDLKSVVLLGVRVRVPPSAPIGLSCPLNHFLNHFMIDTWPAPHCRSVAWGLSSVAQCLGNVDAANLRDVSQIGDGAGNAQYACVAARR